MICHLQVWEGYKVDICRRLVSFSPIRAYFGKLTSHNPIESSCWCHLPRMLLQIVLGKDLIIFLYWLLTWCMNFSLVYGKLYSYISSACWWRLEAQVFRSWILSQCSIWISLSLGTCFWSVVCSYQQIETFGRGTIWCFDANISALKKPAACNYEDCLQVKKLHSLGNIKQAS